MQVESSKSFNPDIPESRVVKSSFKDEKITSLNVNKGGLSIAITLDNDLGSKKTKNFSANIKTKFTLVNSKFDEKLTKVATSIFSKYQSIKFSVLTTIGKKVVRVDLNNASSQKKIGYIKTAAKVSIIALVIILFISLLPFSAVIAPPVLIVAKLVSEVAKTIGEVKKVLGEFLRGDSEESNNSQKVKIQLKIIPEDNKSPKTENQIPIMPNLKLKNLGNTQQQEIMKDLDKDIAVPSASGGQPEIIIAQLGETEKPEINLPSETKERTEDSRNNRTPKGNVSNTLEDKHRERFLRRAMIMQNRRGHVQERAKARSSPLKASL
jgi:hypothetical protein